jgi:site-specific DNA-methyltransferase (adenine-specific)/modification methylase
VGRIETIAEGVTLYLGDCREILPTLGNFDAVVTDPPYGISYKSPSGRGQTVRGDYPIIAGDSEPFDPSPFLGYPQVVLFGANHYADKLPPSAKWLVWDKRDGGTPNNNSDCELAWVKVGGSARLIRHLWNGMLKASERESQRVHPTQKPVAVMEWVIKQSTQPGQSVLDPFLGSGTTGVAAVNLARKFTGIEIDPKYFDVACKRIEEATKRPDMFVELERRAVEIQQTLEFNEIRDAAE